LAPEYRNKFRVKENMSSIVFIGGGNMASCLIGGMIAQGVSSKEITVSEPKQDNRDDLATRFGVCVTDNNKTAVIGAEIVVLAVKPQIMRRVSLDLASNLDSKTVVVSIAAGISISALQTWLGQSIPIVRAMPNTPSLVLTGATGLYSNQLTQQAQKDAVSNIFEAVGYSCWVDSERLIDSVIAVSGSGPAYFFRIIEIMTSIGQELGLSQELAANLAKQTALGAAQMASQSDLSPSQLREQVTSPGGTTERALATFQSEDLESSFRRAMNSACERSREMGRNFSDK
jgi:pyrroline-5-carboxylate reductase